MTAPSKIFRSLELAGIDSIGIPSVYLRGQDVILLGEFQSELSHPCRRLCWHSERIEMIEKILDGQMILSGIQNDETDAIAGTGWNERTDHARSARALPTIGRDRRFDKFA